MREVEVRTVFMPAPAPRELYTVPEFRAATRLGHTTVFKLIKEKKIQSVKILGRRLIPATEVARLVKEGCA